MSVWQPTTFLRYEGRVESSTGVARIVTDAGRAYLKALGNAEGPHALAREWVGTNLAAWLGLPTLDFAILVLGAMDEIPLGHDQQALPGPAFVTREEKGHPWGGSKKELRHLENPEAITALVVFDTWVRNRDRFPPPGTPFGPHFDNVFLSSENTRSKRFRLLAMDHTHCFMSGGQVTDRIQGIDNVKDDAVYGLFPEFMPFIKPDTLEGPLERLRQLDRKAVAGIIEQVPVAWEIEVAVRSAWESFIVQRAEYLADTLQERIGALCWPGQLFDNRPEGEAVP